MKAQLIALIAIASLTVGVASAHVVVKPAQVGVGSYTTFTMGVPVEKNIPTTALRLVIPAGLEHVTPNVKAGWTITTKTTGTGEETMVTEISWTGGRIPAGQRDDFMLSAKAPAQEAKLLWKAYQTYADGTVVSWDADPAMSHDEGAENMGPASQTLVINDLGSATKEKRSGLPLALCIVSILLSLYAVYLARRKTTV